MTRRTPGWQKVLFGVSLVPALFCAVFWPMSHYSQLQTIAVGIPKFGFVVQHGVMVWILGDYETYLRSMNRAMMGRPSLREMVLGKSVVPRKQKSIDDTPPPMQIAGFALTMTLPRPTIDLVFLKYYDSSNVTGGGIRFLRFDLAKTLPVTAAVPFMLFLIWRVRSILAKRREAQGICGACGYDIRSAWAARCPECGAEFGVRAGQMGDAQSSARADADDSVRS